MFELGTLLFGAGAAVLCIRRSWHQFMAIRNIHGVRTYTNARIQARESSEDHRGGSPLINLPNETKQILVIVAVVGSLCALLFSPIGILGLIGLWVFLLIVIPIMWGTCHSKLMNDNAIRLSVFAMLLGVCLIGLALIP